MVLVVDDALLLSVLAGDPPIELKVAISRGELFTTGAWYYRLARAAHDPGFNGALSSAIDSLQPHRRRRALAGLDALPPEVGLLTMRRLVPVMRRLDVGRRLNFLTAEAVATALLLRGAIRTTTQSPLLGDACRSLGIDQQVMSP